ncbi:hypothetical protein Q6348_03695 [Isoptericola sp. b441]|uniref:GGDEF domain-containing protein n=1 Tax=Actinotalea lenta TaxID=3064654 RepID=A0ABT9D798_9CELL|nr:MULTISPECIES: hypothetical protein [unclassified Isoptericola]MDO8106296.1 hypothetical protein [Isoptericola sp. b441]MDO8121984.1 hypothetical protein [Isoptericola sp. b490]
MTTTDISGPTAPELRELWRTTTAESVWLRPGDWYHPAVDALAEALTTGSSPTAAAARLGTVRGSTGVGIAEALDDLGVAYRLLHREPDLAAVRALCEGWASAMDALPAQSAVLDPESGLPTLDYLAVRIGETYGEARRHAHHAFATHALVLVDVATGDLPPWRRMARSAAMGRALTAALAPGHPMAALGGGAFAVLVARDWGLGETVRRMRDQVNSHAEALQITELVRQPARIWIEPLPETHERAVDLLNHLRR